MPSTVMAAMLGLLLAGCTGQDAPQDDSATVSLQSQMGHIHGIEMNPADERVYVATHHGLYVLDEEGANVVGESRADIMGFTVVGPDVFLASGHPAPDDEGPANLGLIRSIDAGVTWDDVALVGESDFHALTAAGDGHIYGLDSTTGGVRVSTDGGDTWEHGATIDALDIAADPASPATLLATTETGLMVSRDAGMTFEPADNQPPYPLAFVDHVSADPNGTTVAGVDTAGRLWRLSEGTWVPIGPENGTPEAFSAADENTYLAAFAGRVYRSSDGGTSWLPVLEQRP